VRIGLRKQLTQTPETSQNNDDRKSMFSPYEDSIYNPSRVGSVV